MRLEREALERARQQQNAERLLHVRPARSRRSLRMRQDGGAPGLGPRGAMASVALATVRASCTFARAGSELSVTLTVR